jgi:hypothetical protein
MGTVRWAGKTSNRLEASSTSRGIVIAYIVSPLLEAADLLMGEASGGLLPLDVGERGMGTLHTALDSLNALK